MISTILGLPNWLKMSIGAILLLGVIQVRHELKVRGLKKQITELTQSLDKEKAATAELKIAVADITANRDKLVETVKSQNSRIEGIQVEAKRSEAAAVARALRTITAGEAISRELRSPETVVVPGNDGMNKWLEVTFEK